MSARYSVTVSHAGESVAVTTPILSVAVRKYCRALTLNQKRDATVTLSEVHAPKPEMLAVRVGPTVIATATFSAERTE